eukprot:3655306-Amphidinium_carterae.1
MKSGRSPHIATRLHIECFSRSCNPGFSSRCRQLPGPMVAQHDRRERMQVQCELKRAPHISSVPKVRATNILAEVVSNCCSAETC